MPIERTSGGGGGGGSTSKTLDMILNGVGAVLKPGVAGDVYFSFAATITAATLLADQSGSAVVDIWKAPYGSFPPTVANTITSATPPTLASAQKSQDTTLAGWTTAISSGDVLRINVNSASSVRQLTLALSLA